MEGAGPSGRRGRSTASSGRSRVSEPKPKSFDVSKRAVWEAYRRVKANKGAAGVDEQSLAEFERDLKWNLCKLWNRLSSGSYRPPPVRAVEIPQRDGGSRGLGVPTAAGAALRAAGPRDERASVQATRNRPRPTTAVAAARAEPARRLSGGRSRQAPAIPNRSPVSDITPATSQGRAE